MPDLDDDLFDDDLMTAVFADVRHEVAGYIRPAGAAAAAATVKRRRRNRTVAAGALAVALVVGPAIGLAWAQNGPDRTPEIATTPTVGGSDPSREPSVAPSAPSSGILDPGIPAGQLRNMTLTVPQLPSPVGAGSCPSGSLKFTDGRSPKRQGTDFFASLVGDPVHVDVDGDGRRETVIQVDCRVQGLFSQVVAFSRGADGKVFTLGRVVTTHVDGSDIQKIWKVEPGGATGVRVDVGDYSPCCGMPADLPQHQWRTYGWDGQRFRQTGGPSAFPTNPKTVDLRVTARPFFGVSVDGGATWPGSLTATVANRGPRDAPDVTVSLTFPVEVTVDGADAVGCRNPATRATTFTCTYGKLGKGQSRELSLSVTGYGDARGKVTTVVVNHGDDYPDSNPDDNTAQAISPG